MDEEKASGAAARGSALLAENTRFRDRAAATEAALRRIVFEAWSVLAGEQEKCHTCGTGGVGALRDALHYAEKLLAGRPAVTGTPADHAAFRHHEEASNASAPSGAPKAFSERGGGASLKGK